MKWKVSIIVLCSICLLCAAYASGYRWHEEQASDAGEEKVLDMEAKDVVSGRENGVSGKLPLEDGQFYLAEEGGRVTVYRTKGDILYEHTGIMVDHLPEELQKEIHKGMYLKDFNELYHFLENYP